MRYVRYRITREDFAVSQQEADSGQILAPLDAGNERQAMRISQSREVGYWPAA